MQIFVGLSSCIIEEALLAALSQAAPESSFSRLRPTALADAPPPCVLVCDSNRLKELADIDREQHKLILLDTGQTKEQLLSLLLTYPIDGIIACDSDLSLLLKALRVVHDGQVWVDNTLLKLLLQQAENNTLQREQLSRKEKDIVVLISQGCRNREIATQLCISEQTVKTHLSRIFRKLNITTRAQLIPFGLKYRTPH